MKKTRKALVPTFWFVSKLQLPKKKGRRAEVNNL